MLIVKVGQEFKAATAYHHNKVVEECIKTAQNDLSYAVSDLVYHDFDSALRIGESVELRLAFAKKLLEADEVEYLLGEGVFVEFSDGAETASSASSPSTPTAEALINFHFFRLEHELTSMYSRLNGSNDAPSP
jgi:hypothetical protein